MKKVGYLCALTRRSSCSAPPGWPSPGWRNAAEPDVVSPGRAHHQECLLRPDEERLGAFHPERPAIRGRGPGLRLLHVRLDAGHVGSDRQLLQAVTRLHRAAERRRSPARLLPRGTPQLPQGSGELHRAGDSHEDVQEQIRLYNRIRKLVRDISALRKRNNPPLSGKDFLEITRAFRTLPPGSNFPFLKDLYARLAAVPEDDQPRSRLMISGGIMAEGDRRILEVLEDADRCARRHRRSLHRARSFPPRHVRDRRSLAGPGQRIPRPGSMRRQIPLSGGSSLGAIGHGLRRGRRDLHAT